MLKKGTEVRIKSGDSAGYIGKIRGIEVSKHTHQSPLYLVGPVWIVEDGLEVLSVSQESEREGEVTYAELERLLRDPQKQQILQKVYTSYEISLLESLLQRDSSEVDALLAEASRLAGVHQELILDKLLRVVLVFPF